MNKLGLFLRKNWSRFLISFLVGLVFLTIYNFVRGSWTFLLSYCNGCFVAGFVLICVGLLVLISNLGGFDIFTYLIRRKKNDGKWEQYFEYVDRKTEKRKSIKLIFLPYLIIGAFYLIVSFVLYFINK